MRIVSISVGVNVYSEPHYRADSLRLQYATKDAEAFHEYARAASELQGDTYHKLILDGDAEHGRLEVCCLDLGQSDDIDLFICYLAGHGELSENGAGWFCLVDAKLGNPSLDGPALGSLLERVKAKATLCIIDCCFAESVVQNARFFASLDGALNKTFIASARKHERAWEDQRLQRSVLSDVLLRGVSEGSGLADSTGHVSVFASLMPHLLQQVPLLAAELKKGAVQEPVMGGTAASDISLPTVTSASFGRPMTISEVVRSQLKRWTMILLAAFFVFLVVVDVTFYHLSVRTSGAIEVRSGLSFTHALTPFHSSSDLDTGISVADLSQGNDRVFAKLDNESLWGSGTRRDSHGLKTWLSQMVPGLVQRAASSVTVLAYGETEAFPDGTPPPVVEAGFLSRLLNKPIYSFSGKVYQSPTLDPPQCGETLAATSDFATLNVGSNVFLEDLQWISLSVAPTSPDSVKVVLAMLRAVAYRAAKTHAKAAVGIELNTFAEQLMSIAGRNTGADMKDAILTASQSMAGTWCRIPALTTLAMLGDGDAREQVEEELVKDFLLRMPSDPSGLSVESQQYGDVLSMLASRHLLSPELVSKITEAIVHLPEVLGGDTPGHDFLNIAAANYPLSSSVRKWLFAQLNLNLSEDAVLSLTAYQVLARNSPMLAPKERENLRRWVLQKGESLRGFSMFREGLGYSFSLCSDEEILKWIVENITPASRFSIPTAGYRGELRVSPSSDVAIVSLGRWAQRCLLKKELTNRLSNVAGWRTTLEGRDEVLKGLAHQWKTSDQTVVNDFLSKLDDEAGDAVTRTIVVDASSAYFGSLDPQEANRVLETLLMVWRQEEEPERRIAIGQIIGKTVTRRIAGVGALDQGNLQYQAPD